MLALVASIAGEQDIKKKDKIKKVVSLGSSCCLSPDPRHATDTASTSAEEAKATARRFGAREQQEEAAGVLAHTPARANRRS